MPYVLALLAALGGAYMWYMRLKSARDASEALIEAANDVRLAARRFGFKRKMNLHPSDSIDDPRLATASIVAALMQMERDWEREMGEKLSLQLQSVYDIPGDEAGEMVTFARWMSGQCGTRDEAVRRLGKRLAGMADRAALANVRQLADALVAGPDGAYSDRTSDAIDMLRRQFR
jgi:hypothetical protein